MAVDDRLIWGAQNVTAQSSVEGTQGPGKGREFGSNRLTTRVAALGWVPAKRAIAGPLEIPVL